jgi:hypothetical protein
MIRPATLEDSPRIADLMAKGFARSRYAGRPGAGVDRTYALQFIRGVLVRNGFKSAEATWCNVWVENGAVLGYHLGLEQRIGQVGTLYEAANIHFYTDPKASPFAAVALLKSFFEWAAGRPRIIEICMDANDMIVDIETVAEVYRSIGFKDCAKTLRLELKRDKAAKEAA